MINTKENIKGITLIALIITIIVLLILAGISIAMLTGNNGILTQAKLAKENTNATNIKEIIQTESLGSIDTTGKFNKNTFIEKCKKNIEGIEITEKEGYITIEKEGQKFIVNSNGEVADKLDASKVTADMYGITVTGYKLPDTTKTDIGWKIFYADDNNIYLIADNYIERENIPNASNGSNLTNDKPNEGDTEHTRTAYFTNILKDYASGSARITDERIKRLNSSYFYKEENGKQVKNYSSNNSNMKAVAYLLDTVAWNSKFKVNNDSTVDYVIGGPTVEMLMKSYSEKSGGKYLAKATSEIGYKIGVDNEENMENYWPGMFYLSYNSLYFLKKDEDVKKAAAYWIASPSAGGNANNLITVYYNAHVGSDSYRANNAIGFRPVVCLNSNVLLQENNGIYELTN